LGFDGGRFDGGWFDGCRFDVGGLFGEGFGWGFFGEEGGGGGEEGGGAFAEEGGEAQENAVVRVALEEVMGEEREGFGLLGREGRGER